MAIAKQSIDLFSSVQERVWAPTTNVRPVRFPQTPTVSLAEDAGWQLERLHDKADALVAALDQAVTAGRTRRAKRLRSMWLHHLHTDRTARARKVADDRGLRLDPIGHGPVLDRPCIHYRDRLPWRLWPIEPYGDRRLPERAASAVDAWRTSGAVFDVLYVADEPVGSGHFPVHSLIGAISRDGRVADWFVLDRWAA